MTRDHEKNATGNKLVALLILEVVLNGRNAATSKRDSL